MLVAQTFCRDQGLNCQSRRSMDLQSVVHLNASGMPHAVRTVEQAIRFIDERLPSELQGLPRWRFARVLLAEAIRTGKSRDVKAATR